MADNIQRIRPEKAHERIGRGDALLVCAYDSDEKFQNNHLEGAMPLREFRSRAATLPREREVIFYCA